MLFLVGGMIAFAIDLETNDASDTPWVDGLYLAVITLTTVGFGDFSPLGDRCRAIACFLMLFGIPVFATSFSAINGLIYKGAHHSITLEKIRSDFSESKSLDLEAWVDGLRKSGVGNYLNQGEGRFSRFEYLG